MIIGTSEIFLVIDIIILGIILYVVYKLIWKGKK